MRTGPLLLVVVALCSAASCAVDDVTVPTDNDNIDSTTDVESTDGATSSLDEDELDASVMTDAELVDASSPPSRDAGPPSAGCGKAKASGVTRPTMTIAGIARTYVLSVPAGYDRNRAYPLVFGWHGQGSSGTGFRSNGTSYGGGVELAAAGKAIFVYPDGLFRDNQNPPKTGWKIGAGDDLEFFDTLVRTLSSSLCVDPKRIFSYGHSYGGRMSNQLGCMRPNVIRAIAPVKGFGPILPCANGPVAAWILNAVDDKVVVLSRGTASRDFWIGHNGCRTTTVPVTPAPTVAYQGCSAGDPLYWNAPATGGHGYPASASPAIWSFFSSL